MNPFTDRQSSGAAAADAVRSPVASDATTRALELPSLLAMIASLAATDAGARRLERLSPIASAERLAARREAFEETCRLLGDGALVPLFEEPLEPRVDALAEGSSSFGGEELLLLAALLTATAGAAERIRSAEPPCERLAAAAGELEDLEGLRRQITAILDRRGQVRDEASPRLVRLSATARRARNGLYRDLKAFSERHRDDLSEDTVPLHGGRLVVKLRAGARRTGGLVHGRSGTGKSFYFEPLEVVEGNNKLHEALEQVEEEKRRLLRELIAAAAERLEGLRGHLRFLGWLDLLQSAARFGEQSGARLAEIGPPSHLELLEARHPLLDSRLATLRRSVLGQAGHTAEIVPLEIRLGAEDRILVVTGPNAGGKTVALKTLGLLTLAHQCGLPIPAARGTRLPVLAKVVATIGDEQDLLEDRSTFSGRLLRLREAWEAAKPGGLVLLDELGSGTDPEEGTALAIALVEGLIDRGCLGVVTTHLSRLAAAALESDGASCAAMEFDSRTGMPTYRLTPGAPGGSEALALARRLDLPAKWLERAESLLGSEHRDLRRLLAEVERARDELVRERDDARRQKEEMERLRQGLEERTTELDEERRRLAGKLKRQLEEFRRKVAEEQRQEVEKLQRQLDAGRRKGLAAESVKRLFREAPEFGTDEQIVELPVAVGARVVHRGLGWEGRVERLDGGRAEVLMGGKRLRCKLEELKGVAAPAAEPAARRPVVRVDAGDGSVAAELELIGQRVEPALERLDAYLDAALRASHATVRIVHGHGSGRLRTAVRDFLGDHPAIESFRPGRDNEGGDGATVVRMRG